ncbi:hypothetical protein [Roseovarius amoyensis]|uniref:hypothetical protein n=1 Tax=Roseovarius amoyensis TaxID=2211448 RepID=UPI0013A6AD90|nr:hypothetical protein [Roseovarius amoyensis]
MVRLMMAAAQKPHIKRAVIVVVMGVGLRVAAHLAWAALDHAKAQGILGCEMREIALGVALAPFLLPGRPGRLFCHYSMPHRLPEMARHGIFPGEAAENFKPPESPRRAVGRGFFLCCFGALGFEPLDHIGLTPIAAISDVDGPWKIQGVVSQPTPKRHIGNTAAHLAHRGGGDAAVRIAFIRHLPLPLAQVVARQHQHFLTLWNTP